jgi:hypothetical protein
VLERHRQRLLSRDVYSNVGGDTGTATQWKRVANWDEFLRQNGVRQSNIDSIRTSGFFAAIYKNQKTGEVTVAFRGTQCPGNGCIKDSIADYDAAKGILTTQYKAASDLTSMVKNKLGSNVTLTGHSLGGALASYAGLNNKVSSVVTFNAARNPLSQGSKQNTSQLNFFTRDEVIGDPNKSGILGSGQLPGQSIIVDSNVQMKNIADDALAGHSINNIIGPLSNQALK